MRPPLRRLRIGDRSVTKKSLLATLLKLTSSFALAITFVIKRRFWFNGLSEEEKMLTESFWRSLLNSLRPPNGSSFLMVVLEEPLNVLPMAGSVSGVTGDSILTYIRGNNLVDNLWFAVYVPELTWRTHEQMSCSGGRRYECLAMNCAALTQWNVHLS